MMDKMIHPDRWCPGLRPVPSRGAGVPSLLHLHLHLHLHRLHALILFIIYYLEKGETCIYIHLSRMNIVFLVGTDMKIRFRSLKSSAY